MEIGTELICLNRRRMCSVMLNDRDESLELTCLMTRAYFMRFKILGHPYTSHSQALKRQSYA